MKNLNTLATLALLGSSSLAAAQASFTKEDAYCPADAVFEAVATSVTLRREDRGTCAAPKAPKTVEAFENQTFTMGMICFPLVIVIDLPRQILPGGKETRASYRLHVKYLPPEFSRLKMRDAIERLTREPRLYPVAYLELFEKDGETFLLGPPRSIEEKAWVASFNPDVVCPKPPT